MTIINQEKCLSLSLFELSKATKSLGKDSCSEEFLRLSEEYLKKKEELAKLNQEILDWEKLREKCPLCLFRLVDADIENNIVELEILNR